MLGSPKLFFWDLYCETGLVPESLNELDCQYRFPVPKEVLGVPRCALVSRPRGVAHSEHHHHILHPGSKRP
uniref:Uncharacterized protein n=1 Tax=Leviviridae sp. TaxID=2027243 RepID=A0A514DAB2_9VIRU|nr:MAG: hypothetical protein H4Bulk46833_000004 [Leviviridae sp.]